jgi:hypothetical protein
MGNGIWKALIPAHNVAFEAGATFCGDVRSPTVVLQMLPTRCTYAWLDTAGAGIWDLLAGKAAFTRYR